MTRYLKKAKGVITKQFLKFGNMSSSDMLTIMHTKPKVSLNYRKICVCNSQMLVFHKPHQFMVGVQFESDTSSHKICPGYM